jgi:hypothetical protein
MRIESYLKNNSENIAGVISLLSSTSLAFTGDSKSLAAAGIFTAAELTLARFGHKVEGYAAGATLFAVGDLTLAFSSAVQNETTLQTTLLVMAAAWGAGALRYPFERAAKATGSAKLQKIADTLPAICGTANLLLRLPGIYSALKEEKYIIAGAITGWGVADVLAGRLQDRARSVYRAIFKPPTSDL